MTEEPQDQVPVSEHRETAVTVTDGVNAYMVTGWWMQDCLGITGWAQPALVLRQSGSVQRGVQAFLVICSAAAAITKDDVVLLYVSRFLPVGHYSTCCS